MRECMCTWARGPSRALPTTQHIQQRRAGRRTPSGSPASMHAYPSNVVNAFHVNESPRVYCVSRIAGLGRTIGVALWLRRHSPSRALPFRFYPQQLPFPPRLTPQLAACCNQPDQLGTSPISEQGPETCAQ